MKVFFTVCVLVANALLCSASALISAQQPVSIHGCGGPMKNIPMPYSLVAPPNVRAPIGVIGIVPNKAGTSPSAAASLGKFARGQFNTVKSWEGMQIFVFRDTKSAQIFNEYQAPRKHWPLRAADYVALRKLWPQTLAVYSYRNGREKVRYPVRNTSGWWRSLR